MSRPTNFPKTEQRWLKTMETSQLRLSWVSNLIRSPSQRLRRFPKLTLAYTAKRRFQCKFSWSIQGERARDFCRLWPIGDSLLTTLKISTRGLTSDSLWWVSCKEPAQKSKNRNMHRPTRFWLDTGHLSRRSLKRLKLEMSWIDLQRRLRNLREYWGRRWERKMLPHSASRGSRSQKRRSQKHPKRTRSDQNHLQWNKMRRARKLMTQDLWWQATLRKKLCTRTWGLERDLVQPPQSDRGRRRWPFHLPRPRRQGEAEPEHRNDFWAIYLIK